MYDIIKSFKMVAPLFLPTFQIHIVTSLIVVGFWSCLPKQMSTIYAVGGCYHSLFVYNMRTSCPRQSQMFLLTKSINRGDKAHDKSGFPD